MRVGLVTFVASCALGAGAALSLGAAQGATRTGGVASFALQLAAAKRMNDFIALHHLHPVIDRIFPIEQLEDALKDLQSGRFVGKIVLRMP